MLGYLRLILAILVMLSHIGITIAGLNPGVTAVVIFYILSGAVVTHLWQDVLPQSKGKLINFYKDRLVRIFPLYIYTLLLTLMFLSLTAYGKPEYTISALLSNVLVIPLNYYMYIDSHILTKPAWCLIPPAWSLGVELQAYLVLPFLLMHPRLCFLTYIVSIAIYTAANYAFIPADYFGYRLIPGVLFMFILGSYIKNVQHSQAKRVIIMFSYLAIATQYLLIINNKDVASGFSKETLLGLLIGIPLILLNSWMKVKIPFNTVAGSVSYGVFLMHFMLIWALDEVGFVDKGALSYIITLIVSVCLFSLLSVYLVENKIKNISRHVIPEKKNNKI